MVPVRQAFAGSVQTLQALCGDCHSEKTLRESAQPTSLEPGVMEYARSPKLPPLVFEAQACYKDALCVGVDVVRCRRNGLANAPFPLPSPADGVKPVDGVLRDARQFCLNLLPYVGPGWCWPRCWTWASAAGTTSCWASPRGATWPRQRCGARWSAWSSKERRLIPP